MALFYCSNCGNKVSDKAPACPKCGSVNTKYSEPQSKISGAKISENTDAVKANPEKKKKLFKKVIAALSVIILLGAAAAAGIIIIGKNPNVKSIEITSWDFYDDTSDSDGYFVGTVTADNKNPFIAVVTKKSTDNDEETDEDTSDERPKYENINYKPEYYIYMENGTGSFKLDGSYEPNDYAINTYFVGKPLKEKDFTSIQYNYTDYRDNQGDNTISWFDVKMTMKKKQSGVLFCTFHNTLTNVDSMIIEAPVVNGEVYIDYFAANRYGLKLLSLYDSLNELIDVVYYNFDDVTKLPYKSRDTNAIVLQSMYFVPMSSGIQNDEIITEKDYFDRSTTSFTHEFEATLNNAVPDGLLLYSTTLVEGGDNKVLNEEYFDIAALGNGKAHISTYYSFDDEKFESPKNQYRFYGYVEAKKINN